MNITISSDLTSLLPENDEYSKIYRELFSGENVDDSLALVIKINGDRESGYAVAETLKNEMDKLVDIVKYVRKTDNVSMMGNTGLLLSNNDVFRKLSSTFNYVKFLVDNPVQTDFSIVRNIGNSLQSVEKILNGMLNIDTIEKYARISDDGQIMLMNLILTKPSLDVDFSEYAINEIREIVREATNGYGFEFGFSGAYQTAIDTNNVIKSDFTITTIITLCAITLLFLLVYGNIYITIGIFLSLIIGMLTSLGVFNFFFSGLDFMSSFVIALLLGLGIDFGIHISERTMEYVKSDEKEYNSLSKSEKRELFKAAIAYSISHSGKSTFVGGVTTIAAFMSLFFVDSPALRRTGILSGIGIMFFLIAMIIVLPTFIIFFSPWMKVNKNEKNFFKRNLIKKEKSIPSKILIFIFIVILVPLVFFSYLNFKNFNYTPGDIIPKEIESQEIFKIMTEHGLLYSLDSAVIVFVDDPEKLPAVQERLQVGSKFIGNTTSLASYIPKELFQNFSTFKAETLKILNSQQNALTVMLLKKYNAYDEIGGLITALEKSRSFSELIKYIFENDLLPQEAKKFFISEINGKMYFKVYAEPKINIWKNNRLKEFVEDINQTGFDFFGYPILYYRVMQKVITSIIFAVLLAAVIIGITVLIAMRDFKDSGLVLLSLLITIAMLYGITYMLGFRMNFMTLLSLPLILGMAIDGPIHIIQRFREENNSHDENESRTEMFRRLLRGTGKAITLSAVTTSIAFLSFIFASSPILKEFGMVMSLGITFNWIVTFFWIVSFKRNFGNNGKKEKKDIV